MAQRRSTVASFGWLSKKHGLTEAEVRDMDIRYKNADLDRSGQLDREELKSLLRSTIAHGMNDQQLDTYLTSQWHNVDKDNSGSVDFDEFLALYAILKLEASRSRRGVRPAASAGTAAGQSAGQSSASAGAASGAAAGASAGSAAKAAASSSSSSSSSSVTGAAGKKRREKRKPRKNRKHPQRTFTPTGALTQQNYLSNDIVWSALREHHAFLVKREHAVFSTEPGNLRNLHSLRSSGLATNKTVDLSGNNEGLTLRLRADSKRRQSTPARLHVSQTYKQPNRVMARKLKARLNAYGRGDLTNAALARMTRIRQSLGAAGGVAKKTPRTRARRANKST